MDVRPIRTEADYRQSLEEIATLMDASMGSPGGDRFDARRYTYLLLQTRTRALDGMLRPLFERRYQGFANDNSASAIQAAAA